jgi:hypothetical protein
MYSRTAGAHPRHYEAVEGLGHVWTIIIITSSSSSPSSSAAAEERKLYF